jgi:hypothetical protein
MANAKAAGYWNPLLLDQVHRFVDRIGGRLMPGGRLLGSNLFRKHERQRCEQQLIIFVHSHAK